MKLGMTTCCLLAGCGLASLAWGRSPIPLDPPTPPPCAADGTCYPNRGAWGWYQSRWRRWPGDELAPIPTGAEPTPAERIGPELQPTEIPSPGLEGAAAPPPPPTTKKRPAGPEATDGEPSASPGPDGGAPATPPSGVPLAPPYESPPPVPLESPFPDTTSDLDPPPALPPAMVAGHGLTSAVRSTDRVSGLRRGNLGAARA